MLVSLRERNILIAPWKKLLDLRGFLGLYWRRVLPVLCNELLWSLSIVLLNMILGRMGTENYAALTVVRTVENVVYVFFVGVCSACNVLIGKRIGEGDEAAARLYARRFLVLIPLLGAAFGLLVAALRVPVLSLFDMSDAARAMAMGMMLVYAVDVGIRNVPYLCVVGIFRAGGDTRYGLIGDVVVNYGLVLPAVLLCSSIPGFSFLLTYIIMLAVDDVGKLAFYLPRIFSMKWIRPVADRRAEALRQADA